MTAKTIRFDADQEKMYEKVKEKVYLNTGMTKDNDIIIYLMFQFMRPEIESDAISIKLKKKKDEYDIPEEVQEEYDKYMADDKDIFCVNHLTKLKKNCVCYTNGDGIHGFLRLAGYAHKQIS